MLIDGKLVSERIRKEILDETKELAKKHHHKPHLSVIIVGEIQPVKPMLTQRRKLQKQWTLMPRQLECLKTRHKNSYLKKYKN
jgi:5,10-methylene-tetrahydrofolate dehydrogenase/methenyl tetrahydrofolate cyclohydrolase